MKIFQLEVFCTVSEWVSRWLGPHWLVCWRALLLTSEWHEKRVLIWWYYDVSPYVSKQSSSQPHTNTDRGVFTNSMHGSQILSPYAVWPGGTGSQAVSVMDENLWDLRLLKWCGSVLLNSRPWRWTALTPPPRIILHPFIVWCGRRPAHYVGDAGRGRSLPAGRGRSRGRAGMDSHPRPQMRRHVQWSRTPVHSPCTTPCIHIAYTPYVHKDQAIFVSNHITSHHLPSRDAEPMSFQCWSSVADAVQH